MRSIIAICLILGLVGTALAATTSSNTPGTFYRGGYKILDIVTNSTVDGATTSWGSTTNVYQGVNTKFYPGTDNTTVWLTSCATPGASSAACITRKLLAAPITNGTTTAAVDAVAVTGTTSTVTFLKTFRSTSTRLFGVAANAYVIAQSETDSTNNYEVLTVYTIVAGAANTGKGLVTSSTFTTYSSGATDGNDYAFAPLAIWGEDSATYVLYEAHLNYQVKTAGSSAVKSSNGVFIQGYNSTANIYTTPAAVIAAGTITLPTAMGTSSINRAAAGGSNYTNSTMWLVILKDNVAAPTKVYAYTVARTTGTATSVATLAGVGTSSSGTNYVEYSAGGIIPSVNNGTYGFIVGSVQGASPYTYNLSVLLNGSATPADLGLTIGTPSGATTIPTGFGFRYSTGFGVVGITQTGSTAYNYYYKIYFGNGTANTTALSAQAALGTFDASTTGLPPSFFVDPNGTAWMGYGTVDTTSGGSVNGQVQTYSVAQIVQNVNAYYPSAGNALVAIVALLSFVIMSLFMF